MDIKTFVAYKGGSTKLARALKLPEKSGRQTVHNWIVRGKIPPAVILSDPVFFKVFIVKRGKKNKQ